MSIASPPRPPVGRPQLPLPSQTPTAKRRERLSPRHDLRCSVGDAASYSVMVGIGETYFAAFALALGTGETFAGLIATLPMLAGAFLQLATPWALRRLGSFRRCVVLCATLQATALLVMPVAAWLAGSSVAAWVFVSATAYWAASLATGPAWNTWIEEIIPKRVRAKFFACRARTSQICTLIGFVTGGIALQIGKANGWVLLAFTGIFLAGSACRLLSAMFLSRQSEPSAGTYLPRAVTLRQMLSRTSGDVGGRLVFYLLAVQTAVQISGPYFTPYLLSEERLSYLNYMLLIGIGFIGKAVAMPLWGRIAHYAGARRLLWIGGAAIVPISSLWVICDLFETWQFTLNIPFGVTTLEWQISGELIYLGIVQLISGIAWAAYELAMLLMFFEAIPRQDRAGVLTIYNLGNAMALVFGSLIGASILQLFGENHYAYLALFGASSLVRLSTLPLLARLPNRPVEIIQPALRVIAVRPDDGAFDRPILSSLSEREPESP